MLCEKEKENTWVYNVYVYENEEKIHLEMYALNQ